MKAALPVQPTTRDLLLAAGRDIVVERGFRAMTVRHVAAVAGANLGSFVYHFGSRDAFVAELIEVWYGPLFVRVSAAVGGHGRAVERLRSAILQLVDFGIEQDVFLGRLVMAAANNEPAARDFLRSLTKRHPRLLVRLVRLAQAEGSLEQGHPLQLICFLMASVGLPRLMASAWHGPPLFGRAASAALGRIVRDREHIVQRLDWALRGLTPEVGNDPSDR